MRIGPPQICLGAVFILGSIACVVGAARNSWPRTEDLRCIFILEASVSGGHGGDSVVLFKEVDELKFQATRVFCA